MNDCPNCEYHRQRAQRWREEVYKLSGHPLPDRQVFDADYNYERDMRNRTLEEVAKEFDAMKNFGDTSASFAVYIRGMKR